MLTIPAVWRISYMLRMLSLCKHSPAAAAQAQGVDEPSACVGFAAHDAACIQLEAPRCRCRRALLPLQPLLLPLWGKAAASCRRPFWRPAALRGGVRAGCRRGLRAQAAAAPAAAT
jgi:hypothetical protein